MDVFVHIKGILRVPDGKETFKSHKFTVRHDDPQKIAEFINAAMMEILEMRGMIIKRDELEPTQGVAGFNNILFWHLDNFHHFEFETKTLSNPVPDAKAVERLN